MLKLTAVFIFCLLIKFNNGQHNCKSKQTCSECIQEFGCIWCIEPSTGSHCIHQNEETSNWCSDTNTVSPKLNATILQDKDLSSAEGQVVQMKPQRVKLRLRRGEEFKLNFQYAQAENYPVDLYYIMDLSASMEPHRGKLAELGGKLAETMMNITNNFRLGFGSFVDKVELPFTSTVPEKLKQPCKLNDKNVVCAAPYSFKNHLSLTQDTKKFSTEVFKARVSGNLDAPEGGFDALMQAIVCKNQIKWRTQARHLIVFSTDAEFHIAGDGKLAGVVQPNDAKCHMEGDSYTHGLILDYPSVSHINHIAKENNINIVFAIVDKNKWTVKSYKQLSERIDNSNMGALDEQSKNVIDLVMENYNKIVDSVTIVSNSSKDVEVKFSSSCPNSTSDGAGCNNIHVGQFVNFTATIKPLQCTKGSTKKIIEIKPKAIDETIIIELEIACECGCESSQSEFYIPKSLNCSAYGTSKCGVCDCDSGYFGQNCECNTETATSNDETNCKENENKTVCSGMGTCKCGQCQCIQRPNIGEKIYGKYCNCDNFSCPKKGNKLCSHKGTCDCGTCACEAGWTGAACECPDSTDSCVKPENKLICNGHGNCNCGRCECYNEKVRYSGNLCDECPTCSGQRCEEFRHCVECQAYKSGKHNTEECENNCKSFTTEIVETIDNDQDENIKTCTLVDDKGCTFIFQYDVGNTDLKVKAEKTKYCPGPVNILAWILGVIGTILLAGLIMLIIWKCLTTIHDKREYAKFENERQKLRWHRDDNPLYKEATSTFRNPFYGKSVNRPKSKN